MHLISELKDILARFRLKWAIRRYEWKHAKPRPDSERPEVIPVEETFDAFVELYGGQKISDLIDNKDEMPLNADYLFPKQKLIAELKTIDGIFSGSSGITSFLKALRDSGLSGSEMMGIIRRGEPIPEEVADLIRKRIRRAFEGRLSKAAKQLRQSRAQFGNKETNTLVIVAMNQEPFFGQATMMRLLAKVFDDNRTNEDIDCVVYFNPNVPSRPTGHMEFVGWFPLYSDHANNECFGKVVDELGSAWLDYYGEKIGEKNPILKVKNPAGFTEIFNR